MYYIEQKNIKVSFIGDDSVGKNSLIQSLHLDSQFSDEYLTTVGVKIALKQVKYTAIKQKKNIVLNIIIWLLSSNTKFPFITPSYLQGSKAVVIVADLTREETICRLEYYIEICLSVNPKSLIIVVLNKSDLVDGEQVNKLLQKAAIIKRDRVWATYITSAKTGKNIDQLQWQLLSI